MEGVAVGAGLAADNWVDNPHAGTPTNVCNTNHIK